MVTLLPIMAVVTLIASGVSMEAPGFLFSGTLYSLTLMLLTISLYTVRYSQVHYGYDIVAIAAFLSALLFGSFSVQVEDLLLKGTAVLSSQYMVYILQHTSVIVTSVILLIGLPIYARVRHLGRREIIAWLFPAMVVSALFAGMLTTNAAIVTSSASVGSLQLLVELSALMAAGLAAFTLMVTAKPLFEKSFQGLVIFLTLQSLAIVAGIAQPSEYTYLWYTGQILGLQSYLFPLWGLVMDYRDHQSRETQLSIALQETGNWLLRMMMSSSDRYNVLGTISKNFRKGEAFTYLSEDGRRWALEDSNALADGGLPRLPQKLELELKDIGARGEISTLSDDEKTENANRLRDMFGSSFLMTVSRMENGQYHLNGVREKERILWTDAERRFLWFLSSLYSTSLLQRSIIERRAETVSQLLAMVQTTRILTSLDEDATKSYDEAVGAIVEMLGYESSSLWLVENGDILRPVSWRWPDRENSNFNSKKRIMMGEGIVGRCALERRSIVVEDTHSNPAYVNLFGEKTGSELAFPIVVDDRCFGVLDVQSAKLNAFEPLDQEVISTVGRMLSFAVILRKLYSDIAERGEIAEVRSNLIAHDLRNILQALSTHVELLSLKTTRNPKLAGETKESIDALRTGIENAHRFLEEVLTIVKLEAGKIGTVREYDASELITSTFSLIKESFPGKQFELSVKSEGDAPSQAIRGTEFVRDVFMNLFSNSAKYTDGQLVTLDIRISSGVDGERKTVCVELSDRGKGIEPKRVREIFARFNKGANGTGLGLPLVKQIMESVGGTIDVRERVRGNYRKGTTFTLTFLAPDHGSKTAQHYDFAST